MSARVGDVAIVGGGLSRGPIALALAEKRPDATAWLIEARLAPRAAG